MPELVPVGRVGRPHGLDGAFAFGVGFWAGYLAYDSIHYHLHHHIPRTGVGRWLRELHMRHHFQDETVGFGISEADQTLSKCS